MIFTSDIDLHSKIVTMFKYNLIFEENACPYMFDNIGKLIIPKYVIKFEKWLSYDFWFFMNKECALYRVRDIVDKSPIFFIT